MRCSESFVDLLSRGKNLPRTEHGTAVRKYHAGQISYLYQLKRSEFHGILVLTHENNLVGKHANRTEID